MLTDKDLEDISLFFNETLEKFDMEDMTIQFLLSPYKLRKLDEHFFKRFNPNSKMSDFIPSEDEVNINIAGVKFSFIKDETKPEEDIIIEKDEDGKSYIK
jgi:hypothetical protein